jgi:hypothetical protein
MVTTVAVQPIALILYPLVQIITLEITALSAYYIYRQKLTAYQYTKGLLLGVHILFAGVIIFEFLRTAIFSTTDFTSSGFGIIYTLGGTGLVLADVVLLTLLAVTVYLVPSGLGNKSTVRLLWDKKLHLVLFGAYTAFIVYTGLYLLVEQPFVVAEIPSLTGVLVPISSFNTSYLVLLLVILAVFILYPSFLLVFASRKVKDPSVRQVLRILPLAWSGIGVDLLVFNGYLLSSNIDATPFGYLIASVAFGATALVFRRASLLTAFFEPIRQVSKTAAEFPFTERLGVPNTFFQARAFLLETDPSIPYEQVVTDFARQSLSTNHTVYVFSAKGSPIYNVLRKVDGVRFYILSSKVSYPKPEENEPSQILIPNNDQAVILDLIDKTVAASTTNIAIVFDSISDMILSGGFEDSYKFVKQVNETIGNGRTAALFLMTLGAHDDKEVSFIRSLFPTQLIEDAAGLRMTRSQ